MRVTSALVWLGTITCMVEPSFAQLSPTGTHYAGRPSDTGYSPISGTGGYATSVPLDLPPARGGLGVPVALTYGRRGVGAAGLGWDVPLSFVRRDTTFARRRPAYSPGVAPQPRQQMIVSLGGRSLVMVQDGQVWRAREDATDFELQPRPEGTWYLLDGRGHLLVFAEVPSLTGHGIWFLASISSIDRSNRIDLEYEATPHAFTGGSGVSIDLVSVKYNIHPSSPSCTKDEVRLTYGNSATEPLSISLLGDVPIVRMRVLEEISVLERSNCESVGETVRRYDLVEPPDPDTNLPRLSQVSIRGRDGTPQANTSLPIASYGYASATFYNGTTRTLRYEQGTDVALPADLTGTPPIAATYRDPGASSPDGGPTSVSWQNLIDMTGDGRPDLVYQKNDQLWLAPNRPAGGTATTLTAVGSTQLSDAVYSGRPLASHSSTNERYDYGTQNQDHLWRETIDVNGDGRLDIIDASEEPGKWTVYLNTPGNPVTWVRRSFSINGLWGILENAGHVIDGDYLPLSRRTTGFDVRVNECWRWNYGTQEYDFYPQGLGTACANNLPENPASSERTFVEWELKDINGDGYPDVVFNKSRVTNFGPPKPEVFSDEYVSRTAIHTLGPAAGQDNEIGASLNVVGVRLDTIDPFSAPITLEISTACGVEQWVDDECPGCIDPDVVPDQQYQVCGIEDVNGDGIADRLEGRQVKLGSGDSFANAGVTIQLPWVSRQLNQHETSCPGTQIYDPKLLAALRDLTGDGIPDYVESRTSGWRVWIGTGTSFRPPVAIEIPTPKGFAISNTTETCAGEFSNTMGGLYDIDGDGKPEVVHVLHLPSHLEVYHLAGDALGNPQAGRLTTINNGYGATTTITYRSAKEDASTSHQVPFPEIVVTTIETAGTYGLGGTLSATRYAYGDAEMLFDPAIDSFTMRAYGRSIEVHGTGHEEWDADFAVIRETYRLPDFNPTMSDAERFGRYQKAGRLSDIYVLGFNVTRDPWEVLATFDPFIDSRRIANEHYDWNSHYVPLQQFSSSLDCADVMYPYDWSQAFAQNVGHSPCASRGFTYAQSHTTWLGTQPPPSSASNVQTGFEVLTVDDFGNVLTARNQNDLFRSDDDLCLEMTYAQPTSSARFFSKLASRRITNCISGAELRTLGYETWEYDALPLGSVSSGRVTSQSIERHATDDGQNLGLIREYEADFDAVGNTSYIASAREDGAVRTLEIAYDEFGLVPASTRLSATALGPFVTAMDLDPITLDVRATLDTNGTSWGSEVDGFGRPTRTTVTPPGGTLGVASATSYAGFAGESSGREIRVSTFTDPVPPAEVGTAWGHDRTAYLDEIGRTRRVEQELGNDYANETLVEMSRVYDGLGRISFEADPYPASQSESTAYGTTYHFRTDGMLECAVRGNGPQALTTISDLTTETFPTCLTRVFDNHTVQVLVNSPDALLAGSPQAGVVRTDTMTAIGRLLSRESTKNGARLELATYAYDRFGNLAALSRYQDPQNFAAAVSWSWRFDSLGQQLLATEPQMANRSWTYSNWGELRSVDWTDTTVSPSVAMQVEQGFDALGRISTSMEKEDGNAIPETEYAWFYDTDPGGPLPGTTFTAGRLTQTHSPIGNMYLSYDAFGRADARAFLDLNSEPYIEKYGWHLDGNPSFLEFELPDTNYSTEHFDYAYDTASRLRSVTTPGEQLFSADEIDPFGRLRAAVYGQSVAFTATDADTGRRLPIDEQVSLPSGDHRRIVHDAYDSVGRELQRHEDRGVANNPSTTNAYDALGRLAVSQEQDTSQPPTPATLDLESITTAGNLVGVFAEALVWGASGNSIRVGLEDDALLGVDVTEDGNDVTIHFERDVTTVEELVQTVNASSSLIHLVGSYNAVFVLQSGDVAPLTNLTGGSDGSPAVSSSFTFDSLGNVRSLTDSNSQTDLTYDAVDEDRVCRVDYDGTPGGSCNVVYDGSGNVLEQPTRDGNRHLTYFPSGATRSIVQDSIDPVTGQSRTAQAAFRYDASGEMFELDVEGTAPSDPRHDRRYGLIERRDVGGSSIIVRHILGQGGLVASRRGANGPWIFPFADARGMRFATDDRDEFVQDVSYSPFGKASSYGAARGTSEYTSQQWNGGDALADFGLVHLGARIYDPVIGRFLSRDPLKIARSASKTNPYAFSLNDPINYADPSGMDCEIPDGPCDSSQLSIKESIAALSAGYDLLFGRNTSASSQGTSTKASAVAIDNGLLSIQVSAPFAGSDGADFYDALRRKRGLDYEIDSYLGPPGIAQVVSAISWVYGDPTQDIGKLPPVRVVARTLVEYFLARGGEDVDAKIVSTSAGRAASTELEPIAVGLSGSASHSRNLVARFADKVGALTYWDIYADVPSQPEILARMMTQFEQRPIMVNLSGFDQVRNLGIEEGLRAIVREPFKQTTEGEITSILMNQGFFGRARFFLNGDEVLLDRSAIIAP